jgi:hypothetical protein
MEANEQHADVEAVRVELEQERQRREQLEQKLNTLIEENKQARQAAAEAERQQLVRAELLRLGVHKVDLAFKAVRDDIVRGEDGRLVARGERGEVSVTEYLEGFVHANPEFLPARISGGSGTVPGLRSSGGAGADLDRIKPGMSREEKDRVRQEIARITAETLRGY